MLTCAQLIADVKVAYGDRRMSDREVGDRLGGYSQQYISGAKTGRMTDPLALAIAEVLEIEAGIVLTVARAEREKDEAVKAALMRFVGNVLSRLPEKAALALAGLAVAVGSLMPVHDAQARVRGLLAEAVAFATRRFRVV